MLQRLNSLPAVPIALIALVVALAAIVLVSQATSTTPPLVEQGGTTINVPMSPGLQGAFFVCENAEGGVKSDVFEVLPVPPRPAYEYVAELGPDHLRWVDSGDNRVAIFNGTTMVLDDATIKCFRDSR
jgi:hypothetical protein